MIIITGGGTGIGAVLSPSPSIHPFITNPSNIQAAARVWARAGAHGIVLTGRRLELLEKTKKEIEGINKDVVVLALKTDISVEKDVIALFAQVKKTFGRGADVLLNNAAAIDDTKPFAEHSVDSWWSVVVS